MTKLNNWDEPGRKQRLERLVSPEGQAELKRKLDSVQRTTQIQQEIRRKRMLACHLTVSITA